MNDSVITNKYLQSICIRNIFITQQVDAVLLMKTFFFKCVDLHVITQNLLKTYPRLRNGHLFCHFGMSDTMAIIGLP